MIERQEEGQMSTQEKEMNGNQRQVMDQTACMLIGAALMLGLMNIATKHNVKMSKAGITTLQRTILVKAMAGARNLFRHI